MSPAEDADLLLRIVRRHLQAMRLNLDPLYPDEEWGFQAQQALELLKARLVFRDQVVPRTHQLMARYEEGPFALTASREALLAELDSRLAALKSVVEGLI